MKIVTQDSTKSLALRETLWVANFFFMLHFEKNKLHKIL
jgi:hypothetical protein